MDYVGKKVMHATYGSGVVTKLDGSLISVCFESGKEHRFVYPACFKSFLTLCDEEAAAAAYAVNKEIEDKANAEKERAAEEEKRRRIEKIKKDAADAKEIVITPFSNTNEFFSAFKAELIREIACLKSNEAKRQKVSDGKFVEKKAGRYVYSFETEDELNFPNGTQISISAPKSGILGKIEECEEFTVIISLTESLGLEVPILEFTAESWRLLQSLIDRLDALSQYPSAIVTDLITKGYENISFGRQIATGQDRAIEMALTQPITFIWGPPGTGKTETLAKIALEHVKKNHRILMLSYSNVSVDGAVLRVHKLSEKKQPGLYVRYGYPKLPEVKNHDYLSSYNLTIKNHPDLMKKRNALISERKSLSKYSTRYVEIGDSLIKIRETLNAEEKAAVRAADFVATTVSKAYVDKTIWDTKYDAVIFDEASMAYIPQIIFSAGLASNHFICVGDFRQLPPIVQNSSDSLLNADIFQYCGITRAVDLKTGHNWLCMLDTQYRMHPAIADFASKSMYNNLLKSAAGMENARRNITDSSPFLSSPIGYVNLSGMMSVCTKTADGSRVNPLSAFISFSYALEAAKQHEVGIITPYHAQSRLLHAMARDAEFLGDSIKQISCATVHQFQGSEKDAILYDAVDCYRQPYPGMLITSMANKYANRLFNVAVTRARGKFIAVSNIAYFDKKSLSSKLMFGRLTDEFRHNRITEEGISVIENRNLPEKIMHFYSASNACRALIDDINNAHGEIRIDLPKSPADNSYIEDLKLGLDYAKRRGVKVFVRAEQKNSIPSRLRPYAIENTYVTNPLIIIDKKIIWFGMPFSDADFVADGVVINTKYRPIIRFYGSHTAQSLISFMEMNRTSDQSKVADEETDTFSNYVLANVKCPDCGRPMMVKKSRKGSFFLSCTGYPACGGTKFIEKDLVDRFFYRHKTCQKCPKCNFSLEAKVGRYGLYIQCCGSNRHTIKLDEI